MPAFVSLNTGSGPDQGYLAPDHAPFYVTPGGAGLANTRHNDGQVAFERRYALLQDIETRRRAREALHAVHLSLGEPGASERTARLALELAHRSSPEKR